MEATDGILLIQLQPDLLASTLADAIRRTTSLSLIEPAPFGPEVLHALKADFAGKPVVIVIGELASLESYSAAIEAARPDLTIVIMPIDRDRTKLDIPGLALDDVIKLLRWLASGHASALDVVRRSGGGSALPDVSRPKLLIFDTNPDASPVTAEFPDERMYQREVYFRMSTDPMPRTPTS